MGAPGAGVAAARWRGAGGGPAGAQERLCPDGQRSYFGVCPELSRPQPQPQPPVAPRTLRNSIGMEFVRIPAGTFQMGSNEGEANEKPLHTVRISRSFYLGQYEVTQEQWTVMMGSNPSLFKGETYPVENVSWDDVQAFIKRLNIRENGIQYRLPSEAEWEYAARAGTTTAYSFGNDPNQLGEYAWYGENAGGQTHPVGQKNPTPWGLYDMHGNASEWVKDWYGPYTAGTVVDPEGPRLGSYRVYRAYGCYESAKNCRTSRRSGVGPTYRHPYLGFRLLRTAP